MQNPGIVICSRLTSNRLPGKILRELNGVPVLVHLLRQLLPAGIPIVLAVPNEERDQYAKALAPFPDMVEVNLFGSDNVQDPLARMAEAQRLFKFSHVVRITHDKIFVDILALKKALSMVSALVQCDYLCGPSLIPGTGFEIIESGILKKTASQFKNVEHISYAVRLVAEKVFKLPAFRESHAPVNLLIDFPEDLKLMEVLFSQLGNSATLDQVLYYLDKNPDLAKINRPPLISVYTCAFNAEEFLPAAMTSVFHQNLFRHDAEYILIDDHSTDRTCEVMARFALDRPQVKWFRNDKNLGLASSSNRALSLARGKYILRLDADDYLANAKSLSKLLSRAELTEAEAIYPDNFFGSHNVIQKGNEFHHVGGALFDRNALNSVRFTDGLRNYEGLDLFVRAKDKLKIDYLEEPAFFYRQHAKSMSKTNLKERAKTKKKIEKGANLEPQT